MDAPEIARVAHEVNRLLQEAQADPTIPVSPPWEDEDAEIRAGTIAGVEGTLQGDGPRESHQRWMDQRFADGWVWGEVKDPEAKTHPLLVDYDFLPPAQRAKDTVFLGVVGALLDA